MSQETLKPIKDALLKAALGGEPVSIGAADATEILAEFTRLETTGRWANDEAGRLRTRLAEWQGNARRLGNAVQHAYSALARSRGTPETDKPLVELSLALGAHERLCTKEGVRP